jgi:hypothetical protein
MTRKHGNQSRTPEDEDRTRETNLEVRTNLQIDSNHGDSAGDTDVLSPAKRSQSDPDWEPKSMYLQRKLCNDSNSKEITYQLRSGTTDEQDNEPLSCEPLESTSVGRPILQSESDNHSLSQPTHSHNLRKRV